MPQHEFQIETWSSLRQCAVTSAIYRLSRFSSRNSLLNAHDNRTIAQHMTHVYTPFKYVLDDHSRGGEFFTRTTNDDDWTRSLPRRRHFDREHNDSLRLIEAWPIHDRRRADSLSMNAVGDWSRAIGESTCSRLLTHVVARARETTLE